MIQTKLQWLIFTTKGGKCELCVRKFVHATHFSCFGHSAQCSSLKKNHFWSGPRINSWTKKWRGCHATTPSSFFRSVVRLWSQEQAPNVEKGLWQHFQKVCNICFMPLGNTLQNAKRNIIQSATFCKVKTINIFEFCSFKIYQTHRCIFFCSLLWVFFLCLRFTPWD